MKVKLLFQALSKFILGIVMIYIKLSENNRRVLES